MAYWWLLQSELQLRGRQPVWGRFIFGTCRDTAHLVGMPHYYFDIKNGHRLVDPAGLDCLNDSDALAKAKIIAVAVHDDDRGNQHQRYIAIIDDTGLEIMKVPVTSETA